MRCLKILTVAVVLTAGAVGAAAAADLKLPPAPVLAEEPVIGGGWYLRGDVGYGMGEISAVSSTFAAGVSVPGFAAESVSLGNTGFVGAGAGYQFNNWFR